MHTISFEQWIAVVGALRLLYFTWIESFTLGIRNSKFPLYWSPALVALRALGTLLSASFSECLLEVYVLRLKNVEIEVLPRWLCLLPSDSDLWHPCNCKHCKLHHSCIQSVSSWMWHGDTELDVARPFTRSPRYLSDTRSTVLLGSLRMRQLCFGSSLRFQFWDSLRSLCPKLSLDYL